MALESTIDEEINEIRRELAKLADNVSSKSPSLSAASTDERFSSLGVDGNSDDADLQHLMQLLLKERYKKENNSAVSVDQVDARREQLTQLTRERDMLRDWLQRGLKECRRVADEARRLKKELEESTHRCELIEAEKEDLEKKIDTTQQQLADARKQMRLLEEKTQILGASAERHALVTQQLEEMQVQRQKEYEALVKETSLLRRRMEKLEDAEMHVQLVVERLQQLQVHIERVGCALRKGNIGDVPSKDFFLGECIAEPQQPLGELIMRVKILLQSLPDAIRQLQDDINAFVAEQRVLRSEQEATQRAQIEAVHLENQAELHRYEMEREAMVQEISQLRAEFVRLVTNSTGGDEGDAEQQEERAVAFDSLVESNNQLVEDNNKLRGENSILREKLRRLKIDWKKVHESQLRFQDFQLRVDMIQQANEKLRIENNSLRLFIDTKVQEERKQVSEGVERGQCIDIGRDMMGRNGVFNGSGGKRYARKSSSASRDTPRRSTERELFQEWKNMVISSGFD